MVMSTLGLLIFLADRDVARPRFELSIPPVHLAIPQPELAHKNAVVEGRGVAVVEILDMDEAKAPPPTPLKPARMANTM